MAWVLSLCVCLYEHQDDPQQHHQQHDDVIPSRTKQGMNACMHAKGKQTGLHVYLPLQRVFCHPFAGRETEAQPGSERFYPRVLSRGRRLCPGPIWDGCSQWRSRPWAGYGNPIPGPFVGNPVASSLRASKDPFVREPPTAVQPPFAMRINAHSHNTLRCWSAG